MAQSPEEENTRAWKLLAEAIPDKEAFQVAPSQAEAGGVEVMSGAAGLSHGPACELAGLCLSRAVVRPSVRLREGLCINHRRVYRSVTLTV